MSDDVQRISYEFAGFRLDPVEHRLTFNNETILLTPKAFETLAALVKRNGHVVTKDELLEIIWPDSFVEESGLTRNISVLRRTLDRSPGGKNFIETVPKIGYRFVAPVNLEQSKLPSTPSAFENGTPPENAARSEPRSALARLLVAGTVVIVFVTLFGIYFYGRQTSVDGGVRTLAVLPFKPLTEDVSDGDLEFGIADALITRLSNVEQLSVRPTSAVRRYIGGRIDPVAAGKELGVEHVLDGNVQRIADRILVSVQLVSVEDGTSLWAQRFEDRSADIFALQDAVAEKVVSALKIRINAEEQERLLRHYTQNAEAFDKYMRGRRLLSEYTKESTLGAIQAFEQALRLDPDYALARDGLATASAEMYLRFAGENESKLWAERADEEIAKALALNPDLAETHQALAAVYRKKDFNWEKVLDASARAIELNPNLEQPHYYRAAAFYHLGLLDAALAETELAEKLDPQDRIDSLRTRGVIALYDQRYPDAVASFEEVQRLSSKPVSDSHLAIAYFYNGDAERAERLATDLTFDASASASTRAKASLASFLAARGERATSTKILSELEKRDPIDHHAAYSMGAAYAQLGDPKKALYWLKRAAGTGLACYPLYEKDKLLDPIRTKPEFGTFINDLRESSNAAQTKYGSRN